MDTTNPAAQTVERIWELLSEKEATTPIEIYKYSSGEISSTVEVTPSRGKDSIFLIFNGWQLVLNPDGTYYWEDPSGG